MAPAARWIAVALVALACAAAPALPRLVPVAQSTTGAKALADVARDSPEVGWSGEVRTQGSLDVPLEDSRFGGVARLLGEQNHLRVWWRDDEHWRVDRIRATGETDLVRSAALAVRWNYEQETVRVSTYPDVRLPDDNDILPPTLAARLLAGAGPSELSRLSARRVAGRSAAGLRLVPGDPASTIARVDTWVDEEARLPLRVEVYGEGDGRHPVLTSEVVELDPATPTWRQVGFRISPQADVRREATLDDVAGANAFAPFRLPGRVAGLDRRAAATGLGAVGIYGRGPTALLALPLRDGVAEDLSDQLARSRASREAGRSVALEVGPLSVLLVRGGDANFLLTGTVTPGTLRRAAGDLAREVVRTR